MRKLNATANYTYTDRPGTYYLYAYTLTNIYNSLLVTAMNYFRCIQANEIARLIRQYITIDQRMKGIESGDKPEKDINGTDEEFHGDHDQVEKVNELDYHKKDTLRFDKKGHILSKIYF